MPRCGDVRLMPLSNYSACAPGRARPPASHAHTPGFLEARGPARGPDGMRGARAHVPAARFLKLWLSAAGGRWQFGMSTSQ